MPQKEKKKKIINKGLVFSFLVFCFAFIFLVKLPPVFAFGGISPYEISSSGSAQEQAAAANAISTNDEATIKKLKENGIITDKGFLKQTGEFLNKWVWEKGGSAAFWTALKSAINTVAYDTATWIGSGGEGQKPMFITEGWGEYITNIGDNAAGTFIETLGKENGYLKFNLCEPDFAVKFKIGLGLIAQQKPGKPACTFSKMVKKWDEALQKPDFLPKFQDMFSPTGNDLVQALALQTGVIEEINLEKILKLEELKTKKGWLDISGIAGKTESPPGHAESISEQVKRLQEAPFYQKTENAFEDAANVFINQLALTLFNKMMQSFGKDKSAHTSPYNWDNLATFEAGPTTGGTAAAKEKFRKLTEPIFKTRGDYNILSELAQCPDPTKAGPTNCIITDNFNKAVSEKKTVGEAMQSGYLDANGVFGFLVGGAGGALEPAYNEGFPYRSMIILRKFRIIPAGWEVAAQYIKQNPTSTDGTKNLGDLVNCFNPNDEYEGYVANWCRGLVDPTWVLKAPQNYCRREGPGPEITSESVTGTGPDSELSLSRNDSYCADEQSCIQEKADGTCGAYGYCAEERRKWDFGSEPCEPKYNTCQTFKSTSGSTVSYLENTLDYSICSADNAGCQWYCKDYNYAGKNWTCAASTGSKLYFNKDGKECDADNVGCHEFLRIKDGTGANLLPNSSFEEISSNDTVDDGVADFFIGLGNLNEGEAVSGGYDKTQALKLSQDFSQTIEVGPADYSIAGQTYALSFYAKDCGASGQFGLDSNLSNLQTSSDWQYFKLTNVYDKSASGNSVNIKITGFGASCIIDAIKLEEGQGMAYSDYRGNGLVYEKFLPSYMGDACYNNAAGSDYTFKINAPSECSDFARRCNGSEAGCEMFTSATDGTNVPAKVIAQNYCPAECAGYDIYIQKETVFDTLRDGYFIPATAKSCSAEAVGCDEFTNLDAVKEGGEGIEYYTYLKQCAEPSGDCAEFYTWEGSDETGYQLKVFDLKKDGNAPYLTNPGMYNEQECSETAYNLSTNPMCRQFYNTSGEEFYKFYPYTVTCSENCKPYRRTEKNIDPEKTDQASCGNLCSAADGQSYCWNNAEQVCYFCQNDGKWSVEHQACLYSAIPNEGEKCSASAVGCREYTGNAGNNTMIVLNNDFEGSAQRWVGIGGTAASVDNTALMVGGSSLKVAGGARTATSTVGQLVIKGKTYVLSFIAKAASGAPTLTAGLNNGSLQADFSGSAVLDGAEWKFFEFNLPELNHNVSDGEYLFIGSTANFYIDDIKLTEITDRYYLIKNSWVTPNSCFKDIYGNPAGVLYNLGCDQYTDRGGEIHYLHNFDKLCQESAVGCEIMIDTQNSIGFGEEIFNENNGSEITVPEDSYIYAVYDQSKECNSDDKGCQYLGDPNIYGNEIMYSGKYLKNNPDTYGEIMCKAEEAGCEAWTASEGSSYFKNPGSQTCEWRQSASGSEWKWYKMKVKRCGGILTGALCAADNNCASGIICKTETIDIDCPYSAFKTFGYGGAGDEIKQPATDSNGYWAGICPAAESGCSEYIDPISKFSTNIIFNGNFTQNVDNNSVADGWSAATDGGQDIELEPNTVYVLAVEGENSATINISAGNIYELTDNNQLGGSILSLNAPSVIGSRTSKIFYTSSNIGGASISVVNAGPNNNTKAEVKKATIDYQLKQDVNKESCNGVVNFEDGCVLFNERAQDGANKAALIWDADLTIVDGSGVSPETGSGAKQDSNTLLKVIPDRTCDKWLACRSMVEVAKENGDKENVCFDIGLCNRFDNNGNCNNFVLENKIEQTVNLPGGDFSKFSNVSGYNKIGLVGVSDYAMRGLYPFGKMEQEGEVVDLPNGNFEISGSDGYPIGWVWEGGVWVETAFKVIDNPYDAQTEGIGYAPEGTNFLKLGTSASSTSEYGDVIGNTNYLLTVYVNTINLSAGSAKLKVEQFDSDGNFIKENDVISQGSGNDWIFKVGVFTTDNSAARIKITLYSDSSTVGNFYFDDVKIRPALHTRMAEANKWYAPQSCRLYPKDDSLSCDYFEDSGIKQKGWWGYCLEYDRSPGSPDACVLWWPVDKVKGDGIEEGAGYTGEIPLYFCAEATSYCENMEAKAYCSEIVQTVTQTGQNKYWSGRVYEGTNYEVPFADSSDDKYIKWSASTPNENIVLNYSRSGQPFGSINAPDTINNPTQWSRLDVEEGGTGPAGTPYWGEDKNCDISGLSSSCSSPPFGACAGPNSQGDNWEAYCPLGYSGSYSVISGSCWEVWRDGMYGVNTSEGGGGSEWCRLTCYNSMQYRLASSYDEGKNGIKNLFAQSYGTWKWDESKYAPQDGGNWGPPQTICAGNARPAYPNDLCAVLPTITNIKINSKNTEDIILTNNQFVNFTFNTQIDSQQMPMVMYGIDWGDNEKTVVSGVEMRAKPNADNPHSLYHLYGYWDLKAKNATDQNPAAPEENTVYCGNAEEEAVNNFNTINPSSGYTCSGSACCIVKPQVQIKDNWGWCNGGSFINNCSQWEEFDKWVVVKEK